jgi:hypothetical protein
MPLQQQSISRPIRRTLVLLLLGSLASLDVHAGDAGLVQADVLAGKVSILLPQSFKRMSADHVALKYPNANRPSLVYTNDAMNVNVAFDHSVHAVTAAQLAVAYEQLAAGFRSTYPAATWFRSGMRDINGRRFFVMEMRTPAIDTEVRNIIAGTSLDDRLLIVSFNATKTLEKDWMPIGNRIIESIRVR